MKSLCLLVVYRKPRDSRVVEKSLIGEKTPKVLNCLRACQLQTRKQIRRTLNVRTTE